MQWTVGIIQKASPLPISVDSSNADILRAGLAACDRSRGYPMLNSVSLERAGAVPIATEFHAVVIASAAGEKDLPATVPGKMTNIERIVSMLTGAGIPLGAIHVDPLVFPISTDSQNGRIFLDAVAAVRQKFGPGIHVVAGLSNVSFGMPARRLLNLVFASLAVEAGADGGIVDPLQVNSRAMQGLDRKSGQYALARALLLGEDEFGMNYIAAFRDGQLSE